MLPQDLQFDLDFSSPMLKDLTPSERRVAVHLAAGASNKEIAAILTLSEATVKNHIGSIFRRTGIHSRCRFIAVVNRRAAAPSLPAELAS